MGGFLQMVKDRSRAMLGDLVVENGSLQGFAHYDEFINDLKTKLPSEIKMKRPRSSSATACCGSLNRR